MVDPDQVGDYQFVVLPGNCSDRRDLKDYYDKAYGHWRQVWKRVMERLQGPSGFNPDDFLKQTHISSIFHGDQVVAQICSRILYLDDSITPDIHYLQDFKGLGFEQFKKNRVQSVMTLEFNALNSKYSKRKTQFPFTEAILYLCFRLAKQFQVECCTAVPRKITKVQDMLAAMNFRTVESDRVRYTCPIDVMVGYSHELGHHPDASVAYFVDRLWKCRIDHSKSYIESKTQTKTIEPRITANEPRPY